MTDPERSTPPASSIAFTELSSPDPAVVRRFLERAFGWSFRAVAVPGGEYLAFATPDGGQGGLRAVRPDESPTSISYVRVTDLEAARARVVDAGGEIVLPPVELPGMGRFFWFRPPGGPLLACWQDLPATSLGEKNR